MSEAAKIILTGQSLEQLKKEILAIKTWDGGANYQILVEIGKYNPFEKNNPTYGERILDSIENVEAAIHGDLAKYITKNFKMKNKVLKTGGNDDFWVVDDPDSHDADGRHIKRRNSLTNMTPKKKRKKKPKKTHRKK